MRKILIPLRKEIIAGVGNLELSELKVFDFPVFKSIQSEFKEGAFSAIIQTLERSDIPCDKNRVI